MEQDDILHDAIEAFKHGDYNKTINICKHLVKSFSNSKIYNLYGLALQKNNEIKSLIEKFNKALKIEPENCEIYINLAISLKYNSQLNLSEKMYTKCLKINPNYLPGIINFALLKEGKNEIKKAIELFLRALEIKLNSNIQFILNKLTQLYLSMGLLEDAKNFASKSINIYPGDINSYKILSELTNNKDNPTIIKKMEEMINSPQITDKGTIMLLFSLGKAYESLNNYREAFNYFDKGNKLKKEITKSNLNDLNKLKKIIIDIFKDLNLNKISKNSDKKTPIFIIGMPRSGTTLVEQIISSHKEVQATGENGILLNVVAKNFLKEDKLQKKLFHEDLLSKINLIQKEYLDIVLERNFLSDILTDKSLENIFLIGFIKIYFPGSKIILVDRDIKNVFWSIYKTNFLTNYMNWTYDKHEIINYYKIYKELLKFWMTSTSKDIYKINYEKLIDNQDFEIKRLINFCGLKWDPNCLNPQNNFSPIKTASILQARKAIYSSSKNSIDNYSIYLKDAFKLLDNKI